MIGDCNTLSPDELTLIVDALAWMGMPTAWVHRIDITESGQVYVGLTEILPRNSIKRD